MLTDRYGLALSTASAAARDAYVEGTDLMLTFYPGAVRSYDRAIAGDPGFAMAYAGKAQALMRQGQVAAARAVLTAAKEVAACLSEREASHIGFFELVFAGQTDAAIAALQEHLAAWPRDALVVASAASANGVIANSGRVGQKHQIAVLMDSLAPRYGDDFWFLSYHAMALCEDGQLREAHSKIEQSLAANPKNGYAAHGFAHVSYESGEVDTGRSFLSSWLTSYPRDESFYGHLSWHLSLFEIQAANWAQATRTYHDAFALGRHSGGPQQKMWDGASFLWRSELAGQPRDAASWRALYDYAKSALPQPGSGLADLHVILAQAVMGDDAGLAARAGQMEELAREGRYPSGSYLSALARGFAAFEHRDFSGAITALAPLAGDNERIGGSRAQHDLIDFTLLRACINANRLEEARRLLAARRPGAVGVPVLGVESVH